MDGLILVFVAQLEGHRDFMFFAPFSFSFFFLNCRVLRWWLRFQDRSRSPAFSFGFFVGVRAFVLGGLLCFFALMKT